MREYLRTDWVRDFDADILAIEAEAASRAGLRCDCPESGTSGSCPFHDSWTAAPALRGRERYTSPVGVMGLGDGQGMLPPLPDDAYPPGSVELPLAPVALDVERLTRVLWNLDGTAHKWVNLSIDTPAFAAAIAAAYEQESGLDIQEADMCPNCVTPWKCNGPHLSPAAYQQEGQG
jgi:hypothetical protein